MTYLSEIDRIKAVKGGGFMPVPNTANHFVETTSYNNTVYDKLYEAELQAASTTERLSHDKVMDKARKFLGGAVESKRDRSKGIADE